MYYPGHYNALTALSSPIHHPLHFRANSTQLHPGPDRLGITPSCFTSSQTLRDMNHTQIRPRGPGCNAKTEPTSSSCTRKVTLCPCSAVSRPSAVRMRRPWGGLPGHCWGLAVYLSRTPSVQLLETTFRYLQGDGEIRARC